MGLIRLPWKRSNKGPAALREGQAFILFCFSPTVITSVQASSAAGGAGASSPCGGSEAPRSRVPRGGLRARLSPRAAGGGPAS